MVFGGGVGRGTTIILPVDMLGTLCDKAKSRPRMLQRTAPGETPPPMLQGLQCNRGGLASRARKFSHGD